MNDLKGFLDALAYREAHPRAAGAKPGHRPFMTISRQTGAGGHTLARVVVQEMQKEDEPIFRGWQVFDRQLAEKLMEDSKLRVSMQSLLTEEYRSQTEDAIFTLLGGETSQYALLKKLFEIIRTLAALGGVIIVGRAGMCVARGLPDGLHLRLVASEPVRVKRIMGLFHLSEQEAREMVAEQDRDRARLVRDYFHRDINDPLLYDATWNTDTASFDAIAASVIALIKHRARADATPAQPLQPLPGARCA
jgi:cytidylate kinase